MGNDDIGPGEHARQPRAELGDEGFERVRDAAGESSTCIATTRSWIGSTASGTGTTTALPARQLGPLVDGTTDPASLVPPLPATIRTSCPSAAMSPAWAAITDSTPPTIGDAA